MDATPFEDVWHLISIETRIDGFAVVCIPHGAIGSHDTWFDAVIGHYTHDHEYMGAKSIWEA
jgi:hypothetical protein